MLRLSSVTRCSKPRLSFVIWCAKPRLSFLSRRSVIRRPLCVMLGDLRTLNLSSAPFDRSPTSEINLLVLKKIARRRHRGLRRSRSHRRKYEVKLRSVCSVVERP